MRKQRLFVIAALFAMTVVSIFLVAQCTGKDAHETVQVRLKWIYQAQFAGFFVAREKGFYHEEGLEVSLNPGGVDFPAIQMVAGGAEQFGVTGADQLLLARDKGVPVVALAVLYRKSPMVFFSLKDSGIRTPRDFIGKRVGVKLGGNEELTYRAMMAAAKIDTASVTEVPVKYDMSPLFSHQVDVWPGYAINEPIVAQENGFEVNLIWPSDYGVDLYADTLFTTEKEIREHSQQVQRFVTATIRGWTYALEHPEEAVDCTLRYGSSLKREHESRMMQASIPLIKPSSEPVGAMTESKWKEMAQLLLELGFVSKKLPVEGTFTTAFLPAVSR